jgi:hypothetical protein
METVEIIHIFPLFSLSSDHFHSFHGEILVKSIIFPDFWAKSAGAPKTSPRSAGREDHAELRNAKPPSITLGGWVCDRKPSENQDYCIMVTLWLFN